MPYTYSDYGIYLPADFLLWLADSNLRMAMYRLQVIHPLIRLLHLLSMAIFFGGVLVLDLRLLGWSPPVTLGHLNRLLRPWLHGSFAVVMITGVLLFLFDPIQVGSHTYFVPKLLLCVIGMATTVFQHPQTVGWLGSTGAVIAGRLRAVAAISLVAWVAVIACSTFNKTEQPKFKRSQMPKVSLIVQNLMA